MRQVLARNGIDWLVGLGPWGTPSPLRVARGMFWEQEVAGSNPAIPTNQTCRQ